MNIITHIAKTLTKYNKEIAISINSDNPARRPSLTIIKEEKIFSFKRSRIVRQLSNNQPTTYKVNLGNAINDNHYTPEEISTMNFKAHLWIHPDINIYAIDLNANECIKIKKQRNGNQSIYQYKIQPGNEQRIALPRSTIYIDTESKKIHCLNQEIQNNSLIEVNIRF